MKRQINQRVQEIILKLLICSWGVVFVLSGCNRTIVEAKQPTHQVATTPAAIANELPVTNTLQPDQAAEVSPLPLSEQVQSTPGWQSFIHPNGIAFQYPSDWQVVDIYGVHDPNSDDFMYAIRPSNDERSISAVVIFSQPLPRQQASTLCHQTGDVIAPDNFLGPTLVVWHKSLVIEGTEWCLYIQGRETARTWDGLEYLEEKAGAITVGSIIAVHYMDAKESYVTLSGELDREMLITIDRDGGEAVWSNYLQEFKGILATVTITR